MRERLPKIRASQHGSDPLWKSEKRRRRSKTGGCCGSSEVAIVVPRCSWRRIFCGKRPFFGTKDGEHFRRAKVSWDGGDVAPVPRFPVSRGDRKKIQRYCKCAQEICLTVGVHLTTLGLYVCPVRAILSWAITGTARTIREFSALSPAGLFMDERRSRTGPWTISVHFRQRGRQKAKINERQNLGGRETLTGGDGGILRRVVNRASYTCCPAGPN